MALSRKTVSLIVGLIVISLGGLIAMQSSLLSNAMELKKQTFRNNVIAALNSTAQKLEEGEAAAAALDLTNCPPGDSTVTIMTMIRGGRGATGMFQQSYSYTSGDREPAVRFVDGSVQYAVEKEQRVRIEVYDENGRLDTVLLDTLAPAGSHQIQIGDHHDSDQTYMFKYVADETTFMLRMADSVAQGTLQDAADDSGKIKFVNQVINRLIVAEMGPVGERVKPEQLDSVLHASFEESGIEIDYAYGVTTGDDDSLWLVRPAVYREELQSSDFRVKLFPRDFLAAENDLIVYFPGQKSYLWQQVGGELTLTALFILIIVFCFVYTIKTIIAQKRTAGLMVDFVNNMTHEFKTPISTVALACEAIQRDDVINDRGKVVRFSGMIQNEVARMRNQAEKILQMAALEEGDFELLVRPVDLHEVIEQVLASGALQVENRKGSIEQRLEADNRLVMGDKVHLTAVIHSVLDNANKYSPYPPKISVKTENIADQIVLSIEDKGRGISKENQVRIFDKYFRVSSGNIHDVKGFGLGLSYVRLIVNAHKGEVTVKSELGKGTCLKIVLPTIVTNGEEKQP